MRWRRSNKRPKWFKAVRRLDEAEGKERFKPFRLEESRIKRSPYTHPYKRLNVEGEAVSKRWEPKPLLDIFNEENCVVVVAELKGFKRENIKVSVENQQLTLSAKSQNRRYYKRLNLPDVVIPESMHTTYKNGVLEIRLRKAAKESAISKLAG
ncbi:MAG: Hsp20/alpha crystallin family protein [Candidatus Bathyarchaeia archaeon]